MIQNRERRKTLPGWSTISCENSTETRVLTEGIIDGTFVLLAVNSRLFYVSGYFIMEGFLTQGSNTAVLLSVETKTP